jgi:enoyl-CoA hydratase/carnithine racemase
MARLPELMGRGRALEVLLGADDFPGALAERYGYVNRAVPDTELEEFVTQFAQRIAGFEKAAVQETKLSSTRLPCRPMMFSRPAWRHFSARSQGPRRGRGAYLLCRTDYKNIPM